MIFIHVNKKQCGHGVVSSTPPALPTWGHPPGDGTGRMSPAENEGLDKTLTGVREAKPAVACGERTGPEGATGNDFPGLHRRLTESSGKHQSSVPKGNTSLAEAKQKELEVYTQNLPEPRGVRPC
ncbi:hypothetical protein mRhiFer1_008545 [Rhinolophus ferrumequinum]|uniref:Uncharacterized protein n=1 Tax=Rhinolophus ferrumequinum TaxID=59479 RepID=A0A7J7UJE5_RHIFE|nr:hypothetical protein mRhiFer1_008545 [Rhinolophus ferrumequinum]